MFVLIDIVSAPAINHYADAGEARPNIKVVIYSDIQIFICMLWIIIEHIELQIYRYSDISIRSEKDSYAKTLIYK